MTWLHELLGFVTDGFLWNGAATAVEISAVAMAGGVVLGLGLALMRLSRLPPIRWAAWFYIWFVRGTPQLLQLVFLYDALPPVGIKLDTFTTAVLGFALNEAAFSAEIIRGGILSVNRNQSVAAAAFGMRPFLTLRRIILPQAMRAILPGLSNDVIAVLKGTSIASVIFVNELTFRSQQIVGQNFKFFTVFSAAGIIYLIMTSAISAVQMLLERHFSLEGEPTAATASSERRIFGFGLGLGTARAPSLPARTPTRASPGRVPSRHELWMQTIARAAAGAPADDRPFVDCRGVRKSYGSREVLRGIDLQVRRGEVVTIMGPSGSGKSTLLRLVNHLERLDDGVITVNGAYVGYRESKGVLKPTGDLARARAEARIGMVFQHFNLFEHLTALENVIEAPIRVHRQDPATAREIGMSLLGMVGLQHHAHHLPHRLSGGQQQRVAIARALAISPRLMLFDEPTSALDPELVADVLRAIRQLAELGMTMMVVTHEVRFAREVADRVVFIDEGQVVEQGPASQVIDAPRHERTRRFLRLVERDVETFAVETAQSTG